MEEIAKAGGRAAETLSGETWGALLILSWVIFAVIAYLLRADLLKERTAHQSTREEYVAFLKSKDQIAAGLIQLQDAQKNMADAQVRQTNLLIDSLAGRRA